MTDHAAGTPDHEISKQAAEAFCSQCEWAYEVWITHKCLFDDNPAPEENLALVRDFTIRLAKITQEYALQQIAKLHDPWKQGRHINLSIAYMVEFGNWGADQDRIKEISARLNQLHEYIRPARDRILSHSDLATATDNRTLGSFPKGVDDEYFVALQEFANRVHLQYVGELYPFDDLAISDAREFLALLEAAPRRRRGRSSPS